MRIDKYLKVSRLIKRRTIAKEVLDHERILINGKFAKPSTSININDILEIHFGNKIVTVKVLSLLDSTKKEDSQLMYELISEEKKD